MNQEVIAYVKRRARSGASEAQIRGELEKAGWGEGAIDDAFKYVPGLALSFKRSRFAPSKKINYMRAEYVPPPVMVKPRSLKGPLIFIIFLLMLLAAGGYYVFVYKKQMLEKKNEVTTPSSVVLPLLSTSTPMSSSSETSSLSTTTITSTKK